MVDSQLVKVFQTLNPKELKLLRKWVTSPFHNQRDDVICLFDYLTKNNRLQNVDALKKEKAYKKIFPKTPFDDAKIRQTMHFLLKCVEEFLSFEELTKDQVQKEIALARSYRRKGLNKPFEKTLKKAEKSQQTLSLRDVNYFQNKYELQKELYSYLTAQRRTPQINWQEINDTLDTSYLINKLYNSCLIVVQKRLIKSEYDSGILPAIINYLEDSPLLEVPAISIYYHMYKSYTSPEHPEQYFFTLRERIINSRHLFTHSENREMLLMAINFCISRMNRGDTEFNKVALDLYKFGTAFGLLLDNQKISRWTFQNIVATASALKDFDWAFKFVNDYSKYLSTADQSNIVHLSKAKIYYAQEKYDESMQELRLVKENDLLLNLSARHTLLKIYYFKGEWEALDSLLDSMSKYMNRKEIPASYKRVYQTIVSLTKKLTRVNTYSREDVAKLKTDIENAPSLPHAERAWFIKQVEAI